MGAQVSRETELVCVLFRTAVMRTNKIFCPHMDGQVCCQQAWE